MKDLKSNVVRLTEKELDILEKMRGLPSTEKRKKQKYDKLPKPLYLESGKNRVLVVGDLHTPFDLFEYLNHCKHIYKDFQCNRVVFIGDVVDNHFSSFHTTDPDGFGAGEELERAKDRLQRWYKAFPEATVIIGNHDRMAARKAFEGGIPKAWMKSYGEVLGCYNWEFVDHIVIDGVLYEHGEGGTARGRIKNEHQSIVQGHLHTQAYIDWIFNAKQRIFGMQVGTGIDFSAFAFAYAKRGKKPAVSAGVVLNGEHPFLIPMTL